MDLQKVKATPPIGTLFELMAPAHCRVRHKGVGCLVSIDYNTELPARLLLDNGVLACFGWNEIRQSPQEESPYAAKTESD